MNALRRLSVLPLLSGCMVAVPPPSQPQPTYATPGPDDSPPPPATAYAPPQPQAGGVEIVAGTYGANCGAPHGNTTAHLQQSCDGRSSCSYRVDYKVIGDPAYGCQKDYVAEWRCPGSPQVFNNRAAPEAGFGSVVTMGCPAGGLGLAPGYEAPPPPPARRGHTIHVVAGSYGQNCRATYGNTTPHLQQSCEGQPSCSYRVDYKVIGDPAHGCQKDYVAEWRCGRDPTVYRASAAPEAGFGSTVQLTCSAAPAAAAVPPPLPAPPPPPPPGPPPPAPWRRGHTIHVVAGSYGQNCRAAYGNTTPHLQQSCEDQTSCAYRVDYKIIGDPAYGCQKDYVAEWRCGRDPTVYRASAAPEAGFGSTVQLTCDGSAAAAGPPPTPPPSPPATRLIQVVAGSYGQNCRAPRGNTTAHLQTTCGGRASCSYRVDYKVIGDPAYGCQKDYVAEWRCGFDAAVRRASAAPEAGFGSIVELLCD